MRELLTDETAVVTGGASGIGRAISLLFAEEGCDVVVADVQEEPREGDEPTHERIEAETDASAAFVECDVSRYDDHLDAMDVADEFGGVDVMVNNAGIFRAETFLDEDDEVFDRTMDVNVRGVYYGARAAANRMVEDGGDGGSIINLSSVAGLRGSADFVSYCTSKGAVRLMTYALAARLGPEGVRVNAVHPGLIETAMTTDDVPIFGTDAEDAYTQSIPSRRSGTPEDVADVALYLASDLSGYVNGESLSVDGGMANTQ
ncbi:SDR family oxidoreductase [Halogeometricum sp. S1BR25-6]|uniref:SDR family oxidoreductase n=1 Tax=Halogeometricum salsisoli TaxID=2950536 RepID=A0ABU2G9F0_9EURY|nr:SDR family oxidoreductase [Halogeometricum sp. S1BR25-6]MDS0297436.1 SDR family oxidoreductase [Halogeometricum sp. S1BR25-6]